MRASIRGLYLLLVLLSGYCTAGEQQVLDTATPYQLADLSSVAWQGADELLVTGNNPHARAVTLVLRLDDAQSDAYPSRFNREWRLPSGPFTLALSLSGLRSNDGRLLKRSTWRRLYLFVGDGEPELELHSLTLESLDLPDSLLAWDFGALGSPCQSGFKCVPPADANLRGAALEARQRPYSDVMLAGGIRGIEHLHLPLAAGVWRVRLWREDPGEWEYLAHALQRQIRQGQLILAEERLTPRQWYQQRYLAGRQREWLPGADAWQSLGQWRGEVVEVQVQVDAEGLTLDLDGDGSDARYLAAVMAWPAGSVDAQQAVARLDNYRMQRFNQAWAVNAPQLAEPKDALSLQRTPVDQWLRSGTELPALASAAGGQVHLALRIDSPKDESAPLLIVQPPQLHEHQLPVSVRFGHWRLQRPQASASLLSAGAGHLRADLNQLQLKAGLPRRLVLTMTIAPNTPAGSYPGQVQLASAGEFAVYNFTVQVLPATLPEATQGVGVYHENLPVAGWFAELQPAQAQQQRCDWQTLREMGMNRIAAGLVSPVNDIEQLTLQAQLSGLQEAGFSGPYLAYSALKRLRAGLGDKPSLLQLSHVQQDLLAAKSPAIWWALADEPPREQLPDLLAYATQAHQYGPVELAGQLNHPEQAVLLPALQVAFINPGYGADVQDVKSLQEQGKQVWFYNLGHERIAAGFYLWRSAASGLLQWHARMPTADPFDPTDGREADFNYLWPEPLMAKADSCAPMDIDERLLQLSEGVEDLRWLTWLDQQAVANPKAARLRERLYKQVPDDWAAAQLVDEYTLDTWRSDVQALIKPAK